MEGVLALKPNFCDRRQNQETALLEKPVRNELIEVVL